MTIQDLEPGLLWKYFDELTQVPRPSKKEGKVIAYLLEFAKLHNLDTKIDEAGNVLILKSATPGCENLPTVILQGHVDMVCEKNNDTVFDFDNDPIQTYIDGDWLKAKGTTLGADNGIGVAAALAILASNNIEHGRLECLFTVDEETGLNGAYALKAGFLTGDILINLDTEEEGEIYIGCAGGRTTTATFKYTEWAVPVGQYWFRIDVKGLNGGHSGSEIGKGLGNANKILNRFLWKVARKMELRLASYNGGNLHNAIAREASAVVGVPVGDRDRVVEMLNIFAADIEDELHVVDPNVRVSIETVNEPSFVMDEETTYNLINSVCACPHGVLAMSQDIPGLVEASTNLASVKMKDNKSIVVVTSQRSSTDSLKEYAANMVNSVFTLAGAIVEYSEGYPGWKPNPNSHILDIAKRSYKKLYNKDPKVKAIHAGLECGLFLEKYPHLDMISCGPTITDAHSPNEQVNIPSVEKWWNFLLEVLRNVSEEVKADPNAEYAPVVEQKQEEPVAEPEVVAVPEPEVLPEPVEEPVEELQESEPEVVIEEETVYMDVPAEEEQAPVAEEIVTVEEKRPEPVAVVEPIEVSKPEPVVEPRPEPVLESKPEPIFEPEPSLEPKPRTEPKTEEIKENKENTETNPISKRRPDRRYI